MKKFNHILVLILAVSFAFTSCNKDNNDMEMIEPTQNIVEIAKANGFTSLAAALTKANLVGALQSSEKFTVFAPTNEAFDKLLVAIGQKSIDDVPASVLEKILLYHVVQGEVISSAVKAGSVPTLSGENIAITTAGGIKVNSASVIMPYDVAATNGIIHTINEVLIPPTIVPFVNSVLEPAYFSENFTTLIAASVKANVVDALLNTPNLTIFAPTNDAFTASGLNLNALSPETIASVLTYHVVGAKVMSNEIPRDATTLNGKKLWFSLVSTGNYINGDAKIVAVDIASGSGVVHVINKVLLPPTGNLVETAVSLTASGEFTSLVAALTRTANEGTPAQNLITVLSGNGPFTVFAPTNAAFQALLDSNPAWNNLGDIPLETLIAVLTYHVVPAKAFDKDVAGALDGNNQLPTANGGKLTIDLSNFKINSNTNIIGVNTNATN
jgi:transforming growth factor-beta-induced protein